ncbi:hypothetical protein ACVWZR_007463 [Bradyrhizobium sp. i1.3.1]
MVGEHDGADLSITTDQLRAGAAGSLWLRLAAVGLPLLLIAPAFWNGYPLLQWDTGGYLARWYEGYLVPSRSTVFGLYLHYGENFGFWINLAVQSLATLWLLQLTLRVLGLMQTSRFVAISLCLILSTALPWLASMLLTDIFAGLSILSLFLLVVGASRTSGLENISLFVFTAFAAATHSATLGVLLGLCAAGWMVRPFLGARLPLAGLAQASLTIVAGGLMLVSANHALSGKWAWTPGGYGVAFGRMMQDGIVARFLSDHCPRERYKLCPYRDQLPATADEFLWGKSMFNTLGRFEGMNDEMGYIVVHSLADYPAWQAGAALRAMGQHIAACGHRRRHQRLDRAHLRHHRALHPGASRADARGAATESRPRFRSRQLAARSRRAGLDAGAGLVARACARKPQARRSDAAGGNRRAGAARQRLHLRRDLGPARPLRRTDGVGRDLRGADGAGASFR